MRAQFAGQQPDERGEHGTISPIQPRFGVDSAQQGTSWCKTSNSTFFDAEDRPNSHSQPATRTKIR
jgi:hypothetical protein